MKFGDIVRRSGRNLRQSKVRTLLTAIALGVGGFTLTLTLAASQGAHDYAHRLVTTNFDPSSLIVSKDKSLLSGGNVSDKPQPYDSTLESVGRGGNTFYIKTLTDGDVAKIQVLPGVQSVLIYYDTTVQDISGPSTKPYTASVETYDPHITHQFVAGGVAADSIPAGSIALPQDYVSDLGFSTPQAAIGNVVNIVIRPVVGMAETKTFTVAAVIATPSTLAASTGSDDILLAQNDARDIYNLANLNTPDEGQHPSIAVYVKDGSNATQLETVKSEIEKAGYAAESEADTEQFINQIINVLQVIILVFGFITLIASFFGVVNTQYISVLERTGEIGLMKALGMNRRTVSRLFILEATWIGFLGAVLGAAGAIALGTGLNPWLSRKLSFGSDRLLVFEPKQIVLLIIFLMFVTTIAGLLPARKASKLDPIEALRTE